MSGAGPVLALDASTLRATAALVGAGEPAVWIQPEGRRGTADLAPALAELLTGAGLAPADLAGLAVGTGPGSYTGLRAAIALARAFCLASGRPLVGLPSVASAARAALDADPGARRVVTLVDARRGEAYRADFAPGPDGALVTERAPCLVPDEELTGLRDQPPAHTLVLSEPTPDALALARLAAPLLVAGGHDPATVLPLYLKRSHAEIALDERRAAARDD